MESLREGTLVCVTDGSYFKKKAPNVCGAGWIIANSRTKQQIGGTLIEISPSANSYRDEMLGMLAIRLFLLAVKEFYGTITRQMTSAAIIKGPYTPLKGNRSRFPRARQTPTSRGY